MNKRIRKLQQEIEAEKRKMANCQHDFDKPFYNPQEITESYFSGEYEQAGVHLSPIMNYRKVSKNRWTRVCKNCGHEEHTYEQEPIIKGYQPKF